MQDREASLQVLTSLVAALFSRASSRSFLGELLIAEVGHPSRLVDRPPKAGFVQRRVPGEDRRRLELSLTPRGRGLAKRASAAPEPRLSVAAKVRVEASEAEHVLLTVSQQLGRVFGRVGIVSRTQTNRMAYELKHQRALPTGASSDIGKELVKQLAHSGARRPARAHRDKLLDDLGAEMTEGGAAVPVLIPVDLCERGSAVAVAERPVAEFGVLDIVINNAGLTRQSPKPESQSSAA